MEGLKLPAPPGAGKGWVCLAPGVAGEDHGSEEVAGHTSLSRSPLASRRPRSRIVPGPGMHRGPVETATWAGAGG